MRIYFHGAARTVTGSMHLLEINNRKILLDCGLYQGQRKETTRRNRYFPFDAHEINAVILSHAHIDHSGNLPNLVKKGFKGDIYCTPATVDLAELMLKDSAHIQEADAAYLNYRNKLSGADAIEPLYTQSDAEAVRPLMKPTELGIEFEPVPGVRAHFFEAGHILGSAGTFLEVEEKGKKTRIVFSGDIGRRDLPLLRDPALPDPVDLVIMECTYGDKPHHTPASAYAELLQVISRAIQRGGDGGKGGRRLFRIADHGHSENDHRIRWRRERPSASRGDSFPFRSDEDPSFSNADDAVAADADRLGSQSPDQCSVAFNGDAEGFEQGDASGKEGDIRRRPADIEGDGVAAAAGCRQDPHDAGRGAGKDRLDRIFHGLRDVECSPVRFQDIDRNRDFPGMDETKNLRDKSLIGSKDRFVEIGGGDPPGEIEPPRHPVTQRDVLERIVVKLPDNLPKFQLLLGISCGKFSDDADIPDPFGTKTGRDAGCLFLVDGRDFDAAMVQITGKDMGIRIDLKKGGGKTGAAHRHDSDGIDLVLDDCIRGNRGTEDNPFQLIDGRLIHQLGGDLEKGTQKVFRVCEGLGLFQDPEVIDQNRIRMCAAHINTQDHLPLPSFILLYNDKFVLTR